MEISEKSDMTVARLRRYLELEQASQPESQREALRLAIEAGDTDSAAAIARTIRDKLLLESDAQVALDRLGLIVPEGTTFTAWLSFFRALGDALLGGWAKYRQQLRDLPQQVGFPLAIEWPVAPETGYSSEESSDDPVEAAE